MDNKKKQHTFSSIEEAINCIEISNGCHLFKGSLDHSSGYGIFRVNKISYRAHRASYEFYKGKIPDNLIICHKCNNKACINPEHLYAGTKKDNARDRMHFLRERELNTPIKINMDTVNTVKKQIFEISPDNAIKFTLIFPQIMYDKIKMMSFLTRRSMSDFIRIAIRDKIKELKGKE